MRNSIRTVVASVLLVGAAIPAHAQDADAESGRRLAERLCARCHLNPGQGEKTAAGEIPGFKAVANRPQQDVNGIVQWLRSIPPMMPNHHLTRQEMDELAAFIMSLRDKK
jgi:cytochrome c553